MLHIATIQEIEKGLRNVSASQTGINTSSDTAKLIIDGILKRKRFVLMGRGESKNWYKLNLDTCMIFWLNDFPADVIEKIYGVIDAKSHFSFLMPPHIDWTIKERIEKFSFYNGGLYPHLFSYLDTEVIGKQWFTPHNSLNAMLSIAIRYTEPGGKIYLSGCDMEDSPDRNWQTEINGININRKKAALKDIEIVNLSMDTGKFQNTNGTICSGLHAAQWDPNLIEMRIPQRYWNVSLIRSAFNES
jgi:hypothetical protein